jgi:hypothetical protein
MGQDREEGQGVAKGALLERANYYAHNLLHAGAAADQPVFAPKVAATCNGASAWLIDELRPALFGLTGALERIAENARQMAADPEQSASSRRWWEICREDALEALSLAKGRAPSSPPEGDR